MGAKASMHKARYNLIVAVVNGKIHAIGGDIGSGTGYQGGFYFFGYRNFSATNEEYDPVTNTWVLKAPIPTPRSLFATAVYQEKIYCIDKYCAGSPLRGGGYSRVNEARAAGNSG
jgi:hypothetical protein